MRLKQENIDFYFYLKKINHLLISYLPHHYVLIHIFVVVLVTPKVILLYLLINDELYEYTGSLCSSLLNSEVRSILPIIVGFSASIILRSFLLPSEFLRNTILADFSSAIRVPSSSILVVRSSLRSNASNSPQFRIASKNSNKQVVFSFYLRFSSIFQFDQASTNFFLSKNRFFIV